MRLHLIQKAIVKARLLDLRGLTLSYPAHFDRTTPNVRIRPRDHIFVRSDLEELVHYMYLDIKGLPMHTGELFR